MCQTDAVVEYSKLEVVLFFTILNVIDNTSNSCNHRKQNSSAHCLIQGSTNKESCDCSNRHNNDARHRPVLFYMQFLP